MEIKRGIPDDAPESTVEQIKLILSEESDSIGALFKCEERRINLSRKVEIVVTLRDKRFTLVLLWVHSTELQLAHGTIGSGLISPSNYELELLHGDPHAYVNGPQLGWNPAEAVPTPPFRWGLYPEGANYMTRKPDQILDGALLRRLLRDALLPQPSQSS